MKSHPHRRQSGDNKKALVIALFICAAAVLVGVLLWSSRGRCSISVDSTPAGATVFLDGKHFGVTPIAGKQVARGVHFIKLTKHGFKPWSDTVRIAKRDTKISVELTPIANCSLRIESVPSGALVIIDGEEKGTAPIRVSNLSSGAHEVRLLLDNYLPHQQSVSLSEHEEKTLVVKLKSKVEDFLLKRISVSPSYLPNYTELLHHYLVVGNFEGVAETLRKALALIVKGDIRGEHLSRFEQEISKAYYGELDLGGAEVIQKVRSVIASVLEEYISKAPRYRKLYVLLGRLYSSTGHHAQAEQVYRKGIERFPVDIELTLCLARCLYQQNKLKEVVKVLEALLKFAPNVLPAKMMLAETYQRLNETDKAIKLRLELSSLGERYRGVALGSRISLAGLYHRKGLFEKAAEQWQLASELATDSRQKYQLRFNAAGEYLYAGKKEKARALYLDISRSCPAPELRRAAQEKLKKM